MKKLFNEELGFYNPSFFHLHVGIEDSIKKLEDLSDLDFSIFFHEYIHFIQDVTTLYGLNNMHVNAEYIRFAVNHILAHKHKKFKVPIKPNSTSDSMILLNRGINSITHGNIEVPDFASIESYKTLTVDTNLHNSPIKEIEVIEVSYITKKGSKSTFIFGAGCVMENMAYLFEKLTCDEYETSPDIPYSSVELLAKHIYPEFCKNPLNILALCDISLSTSNPGLCFVQILEEWKKAGKVPSTPQIIYDNIKNVKFELNGVEVDENHDPQKESSELAKKQLKEYFGDPIFEPLKDWVDSIIDTAQKFREENPYFILELANGNIRDNEMFAKLFKEFGTPLMTNNQNEHRFNPPSSYTGKSINIGFYSVLDQIDNIFQGVSLSCKLEKYCIETSVAIPDKRCEEAPWSRCQDDDLCPFALCWKHWRLCGYEPIQ